MWCANCGSAVLVNSLCLECGMKNDRLVYDEKEAINLWTEYCERKVRSANKFLSLKNIGEHLTDHRGI